MDISPMKKMYIANGTQSMRSISIQANRHGRKVCIVVEECCLEGRSSAGIASGDGLKQSSSAGETGAKRRNGRLNGLTSSQVALLPSREGRRRPVSPLGSSSWMRKSLFGAVEGGSSQQPSGCFFFLG